MLERQVIGFDEKCILNWRRESTLWFEKNLHLYRVHVPRAANLRLVRKLVMINDWNRVREVCVINEEKMS